MILILVYIQSYMKTQLNYINKLPDDNQNIHGFHRIIIHGIRVKIIKKNPIGLSFFCFFVFLFFLTRDKSFLDNRAPKALGEGPPFPFLYCSVCDGIRIHHPLRNNNVVDNVLLDGPLRNNPVADNVLPNIPRNTRIIMLITIRRRHTTDHPCF